MSDNIESILDRIKAYWETDEGKASLNMRISVWQNQANRPHRLHKYITNGLDFAQFVEAVLNRYRSDKYRNYWYDRGIEPPEPLASILYRHAEHYGRECTVAEYKQYGGAFTNSIYIYDGYLFELVVGQGSFVHIEKIN